MRKITSRSAVTNDSPLFRSGLDQFRGDQFISAGVIGGGRPNALTPEQAELVKGLHESGNSLATIAKLMKTSKTTIHRYLNQTQEAA